MSRIRMVPLAAVALLTAGCAAAHAGVPAGGPEHTDEYIFSSPEEGAEWARAQGYELMAEQLADGTVTREEYEISAGLRDDCFARAGWTFEDEDAVWNPVDRLTLTRRVSPPAEPLNPEAQAECEAPYSYIDYLFQTTATPSMEAPLLASVIECLDENGVEYDPDGRSLPELVGPEASTSPDADAIIGCVNDGMKRLYPGLPYGFSF